MKKRKLWMPALAVAALALLIAAIGGAAAYLNDREAHTGSVTLAPALEIALVQPAWKGGADSVRPNQLIDKDPRVQNKSGFDVYAFIEVTVPYVDDLVAQDAAGNPLNDGQPGGALYTYTLEPGWAAVEEPVLEADGQGGKRLRCAYAWMEDGKLTLLGAGETTGPLFTQVQVVNYSQATLGEKQRLTVSAYALDAAVSEDGNREAPRTPQAMWGLLKDTHPAETEE